MKLKKVLAGLAVASLLVACGGTDDKKEKANYAKVGYAINTTVNDKGQVNTTMAVVGLDADDKVKYVSIDTAQQTPSKEGESTKSKKEKKEEYNMKGSSVIKKEWYEQIASLEEYMVGKTSKEIKDTKTYEKDANHLAVPATDTDLAASVTMTIGDYIDVVTKAIDTAVAVDGLDSVGMGHDISINATKNQVNTTISFVALGKDGKVVWSVVDVAQTTGEAGADTRTKIEKGPDYNMAGTSGIKKEFDAQAKSYSEYITGKSLTEIKDIKTYEKDANHLAVPEVGSDLAANVTITIDGFQAAVEKSINNAK